jgi:hypothetical protein
MPTLRRGTFDFNSGREMAMQRRHKANIALASVMCVVAAGCGASQSAVTHTVTVAKTIPAKVAGPCLTQTSTGREWCGAEARAICQYLAPLRTSAARGDANAIANASTLSELVAAVHNPGNIAAAVIGGSTLARLNAKCRVLGA